MPEADAIAAAEAIRRGDVAELNRLLHARPALATEHIDGIRTLLHVATDWPGHFPNGVGSVTTLIAHGADVNAPAHGAHAETSLHWAASCDDVAVLDALLDHGADIEVRGAVIGGGTPLSDAVAFGQWNAARRLIERGAKASLWEAAALGLPLEAYFASPVAPEEVTNAFWCACQGGHLGAAKYLLGKGADINWVGHSGRTPLEAAERSHAEDVVAWLRTLTGLRPEPR